MDAESVYNLLVRKGISATVRIYPNASFNPSTNKTTRGTLTDYSTYITPPYRNLEGYRKTELITYGKGLTGIANYQLEFEVKAGLILIINNKTWTVIDISPVRNSSGIIYYTLEIESGD